MKKLLDDRKLAFGIATVLVSISMGSAVRLLTDAPEAAMDASEPMFESAGGEWQPLATSLATAASNLSSGATVLTPSTSVQSRLPTISAGRADPFSSITQPPIKSISSTQPSVTENSAATSVQTVSNQSAGGLPLIPVAATQSLPPLPSLPSVSLGPSAPNTLQSPASNSSPAIALPPVPASINPIDAIQVSGVLHIGDRVSIIVQESHQSTSRYVGVGAFLANGRVRVKRIDLNSGAEPVVVLEQDGQEYFKRVGDTTLASL